MWSKKGTPVAARTFPPSKLNDTWTSVSDVRRWIVDERSPIQSLFHGSDEGIGFFRQSGRYPEAAFEAGSPPVVADQDAPVQQRAPHCVGVVDLEQNEV